MNEMNEYQIQDYENLKNIFWKVQNIKIRQQHIT